MPGTHTQLCLKLSGVQSKSTHVGVCVAEARVRVCACWEPVASVCLVVVGYKCLMAPGGGFIGQPAAAMVHHGAPYNQ
eukprot:222380-Pelagomonas_calceolata.AAC.7